MVDKAKPGDRIQVTGVYRPVSGKAAGSNGVFKTMIVATGLSSLNLEKEKPTMSDVDIKNIRNIAKEKKVFEILGSAIAPSI